MHFYSRFKIWTDIRYTQCPDGYSIYVVLCLYTCRSANGMGNTCFTILLGHIYHARCCLPDLWINQASGNLPGLYYCPYIEWHHFFDPDLMLEILFMCIFTHGRFTLSFNFHYHHFYWCSHFYCPNQSLKRLLC